VQAVEREQDTGFVQLLVVFIIDSTNFASGIVPGAAFS
jgi:hypothetical protein